MSLTRAHGQVVISALSLLALVVGCGTGRAALSEGGDADRDGIANELDDCPRKPEDKDGFEDKDGCPDKDNDYDGVADAADKCPTEPENRNGIDDEDGCPDKDEDRDGVVGSADRCPAQPEDRDGFFDDDGCPDPDNDGDGIVDGEDRCDFQPETKNNLTDHDGCPDEMPEDLARLIDPVNSPIRGIKFKKGGTVVDPKSLNIVAEMVQILDPYYGLRVEVSGHTSNEGPREKNLEISKKQAEAVKQQLVLQGLAENRIEAVGHGPDRPMATNTTAKGRQQNRRLELRLLAK